MSASSPPRDLGNAPVRGQGFPESFLLCCMLILALTYAFCKPALRTELGFLLGLFIHLGSVSHWEINLFADCSTVEWDKCLSQSEEQPRTVRLYKSWAACQKWVNSIQRTRRPEAMPVNSSLTGDLEPHFPEWVSPALPLMCLVTHASIASWRMENDSICCTW